MPNGKKILIGGVPFGCNNVGDEAILKCSVEVIRDVCPDAEITVSTADPVATAQNLQVRTCELFGFLEPYSHRRMIEALRSHDVFVWCGATGLSDYPEIPLEMLKIAQDAKKKTVIWGVGMNSQLNPAKYSVLPGKRKLMLEAIRQASFGYIDAVRLEERRLQQRAIKKIGTYLNKADLVVVRDPESRESVLRCGVNREVVVGADSAILLKPACLQHGRLPREIHEFLCSDAQKIGLCISTSAPAFKGKDKLVQFLNHMARKNVQIVFFPMDPVVDVKLLKELHAMMEKRECAMVIEGRYEPAEALGILSKLDVAVSSRLHMLILSAMAHVPIVGISPGSKMDNFMRQFGLKPVGSVGDWDCDLLCKEVAYMLGHREEFVRKSQTIRDALINRLAGAKTRLNHVLS